jgi:hypothetical protein
VVPLAGIEPALLAELDFESSASTNSATGAFRHARRKAEVAKPAEYSGQWLPVNPRINLTRSAGAGRSTPSPGWRLSVAANATGAGINRFRVVDRIKHSRVIALHLDSATRAG